MDSAKPLIIVGAGGLGMEAHWVARNMNASGRGAKWEVLGCADDDPALVNQTVDGMRVLGTAAEVAKERNSQSIYFHCAIGDNRIRKRIVEIYRAAGFMAATLIDPTAVVAETAVIGEGCYIGPQSNVSPFARVGQHVLINTQVSAGHHCVLGDFSQLCPGARISGQCQVGEGGFIGSNAVMAPGVKTGDWATVGAASFALRHVPAGATVVGNPARVVLR